MLSPDKCLGAQTWHCLTACMQRLCRAIQINSQVNFNTAQVPQPGFQACVQMMEWSTEKGLLKIWEVSDYKTLITKFSIESQLRYKTLNKTADVLNSPTCCKGALWAWHICGCWRDVLALSEQLDGLHNSFILRPLQHHMCNHNLYCSSEPGSHDIIRSLAQSCTRTSSTEPDCSAARLVQPAPVPATLLNGDKMQ